MFDATRAAGLQHLKAFIPRAGRDYAACRNVDAGPGSHTAVSMLSPYVRHRLVTEAEVSARVLRDHVASAAEKFLQEVCWRTYWKGWLEQRPAIWRRYRREVRRLYDGGGDWREGYDAAVAGQTGIACFDAWSSELVETGYLHNHARMWFASIWLYTLRLPWQLGADFFLRHLADGDAASNTLSWRWVGGLQTRGKTYLARPDNIAKYTNGRFRRIEGLADDAPPLPWDDPPSPNDEFRVRLPDWSLTSALVLTDDDLSPWPAVAGVRDIAAAAIVETTSGRSPGAIGDVASAFTRGALADAAAEIEQRLDVAAARIDGADLATAIAGWAAGAGVAQVIVPYTPVGASADALETLPARLSEVGIRYANPLRAWDEAAWPRAKKGFFPFRKHIPELLAIAEVDPV